MAKTSKYIKGWMMFDARSGNAIDMTLDPQIAEIWRQEMYEDENLVVIEFKEEVKTKKKK